MGRRKKRKNQSDAGEDAPKLPKIPERLSSPFADALAGLKPDPEPPPPKPKPAAPRAPRPEAPAALRPKPEAEWTGYDYEDRVAMSQAYRDVRPIGHPRGRAGAPGPRRVVQMDAASIDSREEARARERLASLVTGGIRFDVRYDEDGNVSASRAGSDPSALRDLRRGKARPEASCDLHGLDGNAAEAQAVRFVRDAQRRGARVVCIVHGKGLHSEGGVSVLRDRVVHALTEGGAAPFVRAFVTAAHENGGGGALLVRLGT